MSTITKAELQRLVGRRTPIRRRPTLGPRDRDGVDPEPTMAPTHGLTPAITTPGRKTYLYACGQRVAIASWDDARTRVPVTWLTWVEWRSRGSEPWPT